MFQYIVESFVSKTFSLFFVIFVLLFWSLHSSAQTEKPAFAPSRDVLLRPFDPSDRDAFRSPPRIHYPETWFHYISGNVSLEGITADLEAIAASGISGVQLFHGHFKNESWPKTGKPIYCLSPSWDQAVQHTARECKRLGLRFTMQNCPGWAMSGGPWIAPENTMRHLTWHRTRLVCNGVDPVKVTLPEPKNAQEKWRDYRDITVLAFPTPVGDESAVLVPESYRSNCPELPWSECFTNIVKKGIVFPPTDEKNPHWIEVTFPKEIVLRTVELPSVRRFNHSYCYKPGITVTVERIVGDQALPISRVELPPSSWQDDQSTTLACDESRGKTFRISFVNKNEMTLQWIHLFSAAKLNFWESEAGWTLRGRVRTGENPRQTAEAFIDPDTIRLLTDKMNPQGELQTVLPSGEWTILRIGHINTGAKNAPAPPEGTGWECNKLSKTGANVHFNGYIGRLAGKGGPIEGDLDCMLLDSWECRTQTWTEGLDKIFEDRLGYSLLTYLPSVFGYVVRDHETSRQFLLDWRATIGSLFANDFYGQMAKRAKENGLAIQYETAAGDIFPADILEYYKYADVPMCEFWQPYTGESVGSLDFKPIRPTVSAAHVYGKTRIASEAFTSFKLTWDERWEDLKDVFHLNAAEGVTFCVLHTWTHQPQLDFLPPGSSLGSAIGTPFLRHQTWRPYLSEFTRYLARCSYLLERGEPVSDLLWFLGDEIRHRPTSSIPFPKGYKYDYCNSDVLWNRLSVKDGEWTTPEGLRYRVLWLQDTKRLLPQTVEKLLELVRAGGVLVGDRPEQIATLAGGEKDRVRFWKSCDELWGTEGHSGIRSVGLGKVISGGTLERALASLNIQPEILVSNLEKTISKASDSYPNWLHRRINGTNWYFVSSPKGKAFRGTVSFRDGGSVAEIWDPTTGSARSIAVTSENNRSSIQLDLPIAGGCFIVFPGKNRMKVDPPVSFQTVAQRPIEGPWVLTFPKGWGIEKPIQIDQLAAWKDLPLSEEGRAFSGTVRYKTTLTVDERDLSKKRRLSLDLGSVVMIASVRINGRSVGTVWATPYRLDITSALQLGENTIEVDVAGTWFNRLVYDARQPEAVRKTWTIHGPDPKASLRESGLLGPVLLISEEPN